MLQVRFVVVLVDEVIGEGEHHELFGVVRVQLAAALMLKHTYDV